MKEGNRRELNENYYYESDVWICGKKGLKIT